MAKKVTPEEADVFVRQLKVLIAGVIALFIVPLIIYAVYLDRRLESFEGSLRYRPPMETVNLDNGSHGHLYHLASNPVLGQIVYVPAYSHVYHDNGDPFLLTITLSVRNTSIEAPIVVKSVRYFDTKGKEVKSFLSKPVRVPVLGTTEFLVEGDDATGGSGASFLVEWSAAKPVTEPVIESVMIGTKSQQGVSFARRGSVISEVVPDQQTKEAPEAEASTPPQRESSQPPNESRKP